MKDSERKGLRTWIEVDTKALEHNYKVFRKLIPKKTKLCAVVKSNAYGHGLVDYAKTMEDFGADFLAVDSIVEGLRLREEGIKMPILVLGYTLPENYADAAKHDISLTISTLEQLKSLAATKSAAGIKIHIKIDTGMHRQGFLEQDQDELIQLLKKHAKTITLEGVYTHFASAKNAESTTDTEEQVVLFEAWTLSLKNAGLAFMAHAAATGATLLYPETHYDMVRIGIGMYGHWPSLDTKFTMDKTIRLQPALSWRSIVAEVKSLPAGSRVGYDFTGELHRDSTIAIIPVGYWHGFPRSLSNTGAVIINGKEAYVVGRVSMDMVIVDVTNAGAAVGDVVNILGNESPLIDADYVGTLAETSVYELITRLNPLIKKFYI